MAGVLAVAAMLVPSLSGAEPLSLSEAYNLALHYDARYLAAEADTKIYKEEVAKARSGFLPSIKASTSRGRSQTDHTTIYGEDPTIWYNTLSHSLSLRQPLFNLASLASYKQSRALKAKSESLFQGEYSSLIVRTVENFCDVLYSEDNVAFTDAQLKALQEQLEQSKKRYANGFGTITEVNEAQASYDLAVAERASAIGGLESRRRELESVTGLYADDLCRLDPKRLVLSEPDPCNVESWIEMAREQSGKIKAARQEVEIARKEVDKNKASRLPQLDLWAGRSYSVSENNYTIGSTYNTWSVSLQMSVPIYTGGYTSASIRQAAARRQKAGEELHLEERDTLTSVRKYYNAQINSIVQVRAYEQAVKSGEIVLEGTRKGFMAGFRTNTEVLDATRKLFESRRALAKARYEYILNRLKLRDAAGVLGEEDIESLNRFFVPKAGA
ncbi:MAG: TolC family outer membrane protein [Chlorobaculum sp.]|nr:TolC family outer membrane protein [Chlorobaculum sp.]